MNFKQRKSNYILGNLIALDLPKAELIRYDGGSTYYNFNNSPR